MLYRGNARIVINCMQRDKGLLGSQLQELITAAVRLSLISIFISCHCSKLNSKMSSPCFPSFTNAAATKGWHRRNKSWFTPRTLEKECANVTKGRQLIRPLVKGSADPKMVRIKRPFQNRLTKSFGQEPCADKIED